MGLVVDHELEMTEIRIRQLYKLVDVFVILESNVTAGRSKPAGLILITYRHEVDWKKDKNFAP